MEESYLNVDFNGIFKPRAGCFAGKHGRDKRFREGVHKEKRENLKIEEAKEISYEKERKEKPVKS